ncbi:MAG: hypothetical protein ABSE54_09450 [Smithella sp.]
MSLIVADTVMAFTIANGFGFEKVQEVKLRAKLVSHEEISQHALSSVARLIFR